MLKLGGPLVVAQGLNYNVGMDIGNLNLLNKVLCAPLAGISNRPFRVLAMKFGAAMTFTEMISTEGIIRHQAKTLAMMDFESDERPLGIQLFGANPESMRKAAEITAQRNHPDLIDINLGCPVKKVIRKNGGAAVLKDLVLTEEIMHATVEGAGKIPVSIKIRTGWDEQTPVFLEVGQIAERVGIAAITLHARSRSEGFSGTANWDAIRDLKQEVHIPVIGNGDVRTPPDARRMLDETGCDAVMIGRAALGNPTIFQDMNVFLETGQIVAPMLIEDRLAVARLHTELAVSEYGPRNGPVRMRKQLGWYVKGLPGASTLRPRLFQVETLEDINCIFDEYLQWLAEAKPRDAGDSPLL
ncbi:MAG: tRNA dihydrouridine synthase DusB [candidate division Zixibacteria bacterium]|nr:tRNA dihydrouridine synthase DusB [candidate division Zixibacteria bacterium]